MARTQKSLASTDITTTSHGTQKKTVLGKKAAGDLAIEKMATPGVDHIQERERTTKEVTGKEKSRRHQKSIGHEDVAQQGMAMNEIETAGGEGIVLEKTVTDRGEKLEINSFRSVLFYRSTQKLGVVYICS